MTQPSSRARRFAAAIAAITFLACAASAALAKRPNILWLLSDDLKPTIGSYGDELARTPNIDRLAARGVSFDMAYCNQAVCAPSRNNLMLGSRSTSIGIYNLGTNFRQAVPDAVTVTQWFMRHGYRAEGLGKIMHTGHGNVDDAASWSVPHHKEPVVEYIVPASKPDGAMTREEAFFTNAKAGPNRSLPRGAAWEAPDVLDNAYGDGRLAEEAIRRLQKAAEKPEEPFFLAVGFARPHLPFCVPKKYWDLYNRDDFQLAERQTPPDGAPPYAGKTLGELNQYFPIPQEPPLTEDTQRQIMHGYYASVSFTDAQIGKVLDALDRLDLAENTIIVLWGDHGWHFGDHGSWTKHTNYEQANRIPIIIAAPGVAKPGARTSALAATVDIYPTLAELAGLPAPAGKVPQTIDGTSLVPVLRDPGATVKDHVYHAYPRHQEGKENFLGRAIRTKRYRLVEWKQIGDPAGAADLELYDYQEDPLETENLATELPEVVSRLRSILATHPEATPQVKRPES